MYEVFLSSAQLRDYLTALTVHGLLDYNSATRRCHITEKGLQFLELCDKLFEIIREEDNNKKENNQGFKNG